MSKKATKVKEPVKKQVEPDVPYNVSYSQVGAWKSCKKKWYYNYMLGLSSHEMSRPLEHGTNFHALMEALAKGKKEVMEELKKIEDKYVALSDVHKTILGLNYMEDLKTIFNNYVTLSKEHRKKETILHNEIECKVRVKKESDIFFTGRIDQVVEIDGKNYIKEFKTFGKSSPDLNLLDWAAQHYLYGAYVEKVLKTPIHGVIYEYVSSNAPTKPSYNKDGSWSKRGNGLVTRLSYEQATGAKVEDPNIEAELLGNEAKWYIRHTFEFNQHTKTLILKEFFEETAAILRHKNKNGQDITKYPANNNFLCTHYCDYKKLCDAHFSGDDFAEVVANNYTKKVREL